MSEEAPRKRSRFDQTEPEPRKASRFDRRSRSPSARHTESRRSRSPLDKDRRSPAREKSGTPLDPAAAAAAAAAKINAELQARKGIQHVDVPPIRSSSTPTPAAKPTTPSSGQSTSKVDGEIYVADGDYIKDIEINDLRNRINAKNGKQSLRLVLVWHILHPINLSPQVGLMVNTSAAVEAMFQSHKCRYADIEFAILDQR
ncbi:hypothetical protein LTR40_008398 [Exophiala xenobiotica]|nr:hypothetical protein LTR40_008398 [Exophiala xenobiotica]